ncbi:unnamed protein product [Ambrosiozyma monospora]|uniref:Unnamed protein product n=1 Tax=Ambrosiozyma monospora TaxID=43982 RepID=A0ACB5T4R7_AMBMO|nr:unnamed protein product [Ambrosiozyma monospora]
MIQNSKNSGNSNPNGNDNTNNNNKKLSRRKQGSKYRRNHHHNHNHRQSQPQPPCAPILSSPPTFSDASFSLLPSPPPPPPCSPNIEETVISSNDLVSMTGPFTLPPYHILDEFKFPDEISLDLFFPKFASPKSNKQHFRNSIKSIGTPPTTPVTNPDSNSDSIDIHDHRARRSQCNLLNMITDSLNMLAVLSSDDELDELEHHLDRASTPAVTPGLEHDSSGGLDDDNSSSSDDETDLDDEVLLFGAHGATGTPQGLNILMNLGGGADGDCVDVGSKKLMNLHDHDILVHRADEIGF